MSNRSQFAEQIDTALSAGPSSMSGDDILIAVTAALKALLLSEGEAVFPGLGRVKLDVRPARQGRNPRTGEAISIPAKRVLKFKLFPDKL